MEAKYSEILVMKNTLENARLNNSSLRANFSPLVENTIEIKTDKKPSQNFINKISVIDEKIKDLESKIEKVIYSDSMTFSKLALIGFYTLRVYSLIESIEPKYKNHKLLLGSLRKIQGRFNSME